MLTKEFETELIDFEFGDCTIPYVYGKFSMNVVLLQIDQEKAELYYEDKMFDIQMLNKEDKDVLT